MKVSASLILVAAALGVSAHPSGHARFHGRREFVVANQPRATDTATGTSSSSAPAFCGGKTKRATLEQIAYKGNTGTADNYGCNMMVVDSGVAESYDHIITFENSQSSAQKCVCFNKIGKDGGINGFFKGNQAISFDLPASGSKVVAVDDNSQGGCVCGVGSVPLTSIGQFAGSWLEFDMANQSNGGWSGADASCLVSAANGLDIPPLKVCGHGTCSTINQGGTGQNAYLGGMEALDGIGLNLPAGKVRLTVTV